MEGSVEAELRELLTPPALAGDREEALRARAWMATCLLAAPLATSFAALRWGTGTPGLAFIDGLGALGFVASATYLQRTGELRRAVHAASLLGLVLLTQAILLGGGLTGPSVAWYGMIPMTASLGLGRSRALPWTLLVVPLPLLLLVADRLGWIPSPALDDVSQVLMYTLFITGLGAMAWTYEQVADDAREERDEARLALEVERRKTADLEVARTQLVKNVSHEFRTPLNHILGATQLLGHTQLDDEQQELVSMAEASGSDLLGIIDGAIQAHGLDADLDTVSEPLDLELIASRAARGFSARARAKGLDLVVELDPSLPSRAFGDPQRMEQVLVALLENALAFTERGTIYLRATYRGRGRVRFEVEDTGVGIRPEDFERIFEAFRQVDESDSRRHGGLGAGLAVCRRFARHLGGDVSVQSVHGSGSTFTFDVLVREDRGSQTGDVDRADAGRSRDREVRVLLATANPRTRQGALAMLEKMGVTAAGANDGRALLEALEAQTHDVVFVDLDLPGVEGLEAAIRQLKPPASTCFVALTRAEPGREPPKVPRLFTDQIPKPLRREQVLEILRAHDGRPSRRVA